MREKKKKDTKRLENVITVVCILIIFASVLAFIYLHAVQKEKQGFVYAKNLDKTALEVGDEVITLKEVSYYIMVAESNYNHASNQYGNSSLGGFWNLRINHKYFKNMAKETVRNACIRDNIYYQQARKEGYELDDQSIAAIEEKAVEEMNRLTEEQRETTQYGKEDMVKVLTKIEYAKTYVALLMQQGFTEEQLDTGGEKYEEYAAAYPVVINQELWNHFSLGKTTINNKKDD